MNLAQPFDERNLQQPRVKSLTEKKGVTIYTLPHFKCIRLVSVRSSLPCINMCVRKKKTDQKSNIFFI